MTFVHVWALLLVPLPMLWIAYSWRRANHLRLLLKGLSFVAILLALAEPQITLPQTKTGVIVLVDTSQSITRDDLVRASSIVTQMERSKHRNWMKVVPFARETRALLPEETSRGLHFINTSHDAGNGTDFETALTGSMSMIPPGHIPRIVLISDGNENEGSTPRAVTELQRLHLPVDTVPLPGRMATGLRLRSLSMPPEAYAGEQIPIDISVESPGPVHATIDI